MAEDPRAFFESVLTAGAILSGFSGTFLSFRIQREASYYRQGAVDFTTGQGRDVYLGLTHFSSSFLLIILATITALICGFVIPLLALAGIGWALLATNLVVAGLMATLVLIGGYFVDELVHYEILSTRLINDAREWGKEAPIAVGTMVLAALAGIVSYYLT